MTQKYKKAILLMFIPAAINLAISIYFFQTKGWPQFQGYLIGTALCVIFSLSWVLQANKGLKSNFMVLLKLTFFGFLVKLAIFCLFLFGGYLLLGIDRFYFAGAFLLGTVMSLVIEVWFFLSLVKVGKAKQ
ncbi:MAG: hypothetical protein GY754_20890 [bacterium]|nr:hypothetical protein [bacterium]